MAKQTINIGASPNDGTGTPLRTAFDYCNLNFTELYTAVGPSGNNIVCPGSATISGDLTVATNTLKTTSGNVGIGTVTPDIFSRFYTRTIGFNSSGSTVMQINGSSYSGIDLGAGGTRTFGIASSATDASLTTLTNIPIVFGINGTTAMTLNSTGLGVGVTPANNKLQVAGNIGIPNVCMASGETNGVFTIDVANLFAQTGAVWRQCSFLLVYSGVDQNLGNSTVLQTIVTLQGLSTWNTISKNDVVGVASVAVSLDTTTSARITVTVPAGNFGSAYVMLLGGVGPTTRPSVTINI